MPYHTTTWRPKSHCKRMLSNISDVDSGVYVDGNIQAGSISTNALETPSISFSGLNDYTWTSAFVFNWTSPGGHTVPLTIMSLRHDADTNDLWIDSDVTKAWFWGTTYFDGWDKISPEGETTLPAAPTTAGTYVLKMTVDANQKLTYAWVAA